ncbi:helix-turn-helix transcriptional regulator [Streptomyces sp. NBC_01381]|uniref:helix-turn-helix domain-containing protein n=1 Tax=Streptomyces sp. NBC_01381 TaxID=2903845 RepID=UPI00224E61D7|nr:helix-turn-helix transcriptional regulator [Streptomyces sp. NBC_01381]MCX4665521.1 helix-turn-helix transcriptional regulator [Streptomyces sp. NBC_01381]
MSVEYNPTWRYGGNQMKRWRLKAGGTREELGAACNYSPDTIKAMEQGVRMPTPRALDAADELFHAEGLLSAAKDYVKREPYPARAQDFMLYEQQAITVWWYEPLLIPGPLQTESFARRLIGNHVPPLDEETIEERVAARLERQEIHTRKPLVACSYVVYEAALVAPYVAKDQLLHLLEVGRRHNVSIQVLPFSRAMTAALHGEMILLETRDHERLAYTEAPSTSQLTADPEVMTAQTERLSLIRSMALDPDESARFIERMVETCER